MLRSTNKVRGTSQKSGTLRFVHCRLMGLGMENEYLVWDNGNIPVWEMETSLLVPEGATNVLCNSTLQSVTCLLTISVFVLSLSITVFWYRCVRIFWMVFHLWVHHSTFTRSPRYWKSACYTTNWWVSLHQPWLWLSFRWTLRPSVPTGQMQHSLCKSWLRFVNLFIHLFLSFVSASSRGLLEVASRPAMARERFLSADVAKIHRCRESERERLFHRDEPTTQKAWWCIVVCKRNYNRCSSCIFSKITTPKRTIAFSSWQWQTLRGKGKHLFMHFCMDFAV